MSRNQVCAHHLGDDAKIAAELAAIRQHQGYLDLANDLGYLAALYDQHGPELGSDTTHQ